MIRTLIAEHVHLLRMGLVSFLANEPDIDVVSEVEEDDQLLATALALAPSVAIVDVDLPSAGGPAVVTSLQVALPGCATVMLVGRSDAGGLSRAMAARPLGLLSREVPAEALRRCLRRVATGRRVVDPQLARAAQDIADNPLTPREQEVLRLAAEGATTAEIADRMSVTTKTVRNHLSHAFVRIGARNRMDAIRIAGEREWL
jgi:two-component system response regulator DesR